jgi:ADP-heptose:LPS heptosyltransferase
MGIGRFALARSGWVPRCHLSPAQERLRDATRAKLRMTGLPVIGVQPYSRDMYKFYPAMAKALSALADEAIILVFHTSQMDLAAHPNLQQDPGRSLGDSVAMMAACDYFLGVDTSFLFVAAAFGIPGLVVFGPTDGKLCSHRYPKMRVMPLAENFPCTPCWRNEDTPCYLSHSASASTCLASIPPLSVAGEMRLLMSEFPQMSSAFEASKA